MQHFVSTLLAEVSGQGRRIIASAAIMFGAVLIGVLGLGFLAAGAYLWLVPHYGAMESALGLGAVLVVVAGIVAMAAGSKPKPPPQATVPPPRQTAPTPTAVNSLLQALQEKGQDNERLAVMAVSEAIKSASPLQLVVTGLVAGYVGGQMLKQVISKQVLAKPTAKRSS